MDGILSWIIFAGLFFFMMRFGCGSHKSDKKTTQDNVEEQHIDPVCGKHVKMTEGYGKMHQQQLYRFCSRACLDEFETDQIKYSSLKQ